MISYRMFERLLSALGLHRYRTSLRFLSKPTRVRVRATVTSPNAQLSTATDRKAAVFMFVASEQYESTDDEGNQITLNDEVATAQRSGDLILQAEGGRVFVPAGTVKLIPAGQTTAGCVPFSGSLPAEIEHAAKIAGPRLAYTEKFLQTGDPVELRAMVATSQRRGVAWEVLPGGPAELHDRTLEEMDLSPELHAAVHGKSSPTVIYGGLGFIALIFIAAAIAMRC